MTTILISNSFKNVLDYSVLMHANLTSDIQNNLTKSQERVLKREYA